MFEDLPSLSLLPFMGMQSHLERLPAGKKTFFTKKYLLLSTSSYLAEESFADLYIAYDDAAIYVHIEVDEPITEVFPEFRRGDSIELFFDTRDLKSRRFISQFCHHFVFFPESISGIYAKEVTKFRSDEIHPLAKPQDFLVTTEVKRSSYIMDIELPSYLLHGFHPAEFDRLGFTYRINRASGSPQNFAFSSQEYLPEKNPHLWASFTLR